MFGRKKTVKTAEKKSKSSNKTSKTTVKAVKPGVTMAEIASREAVFQYIANEDHYDKIIEKIATVKKHLWIGTADIKDLYVKDGRYSKPLLEVLSDLAGRGVEIRLIHAKEPGPAFREDFANTLTETKWQS